MVHDSCSIKVSGAKLLDSNLINVRKASLQDLADILPNSWKGDVSDINSIDSPPQPGWLHDFWFLIKRTWHQIPDELGGMSCPFMIVPLIGNRLASPAHCCKAAALTTTHLESLPQTAEQLLSAVGCLCIAEEAANIVSSIASGTIPIIAALEPFVADTAAPLHMRTSKNALGEQAFQQLRELLANHLPQSAEPNSTVAVVLKHCSIFETADDRMIDLASTQAQLMPNHAWEQRLITKPAASMVASNMIRSVTGSGIQQQLIQHAGLKPPALNTFLDTTILGGVQAENHEWAQQLLLQALEQLAGFPDHIPSKPDYLLVEGQPVPVCKLVLGSSSCLRELLSEGYEGQQANKLLHQSLINILKLAQPPSSSLQTSKIFKSGVLPIAIHRTFRWDMQALCLLNSVVLAHSYQHCVNISILQTWSRHDACFQNTDSNILGIESPALAVVSTTHVV